eukprot:561542-Hanusia_phi.AAC.1
MFAFPPLLGATFENVQETWMHLLQLETSWRTGGDRAMGNVAGMETFEDHKLTRDPLPAGNERKSAEGTGRTSEHEELDG